MDNKQNRQFFWNVKDFLNKTPEPVKTKSNPLQQTIKEVTSNISYVAPPVNEMINSSSGLKNTINNKITEYQNLLNKQKPSSVKTIPHITSNPFRIK
jgi:hypothetical protein